MPIAVAHLTTSGDGTDNQATYTTASITPTADRLVLAWVLNVRGSGTATQPTLSGNGLTWVAVNSVVTTATRLTLYRAMGAAPSAGVVTITPGDANTVRVLWSISEFSGIDTGGTNGSAAVVQSAVNNANSTSVTATLAAFGSASNATAGGFVVLANSRTWTEGGGFTPISGGTHDLAGENVSIFSEFRADNDTTVDASISGAGAQLRVVGVEIKAAAVTADRYDFGQEPTDADEGAVISPAVTVRAEDASGNLDTSYTGNVTVALTTAGGATLGGTLTQAAVAGVATFNDLEVDLAGTYTLTATGNLTSTESASFDIAAVGGADRAIMYARRTTRGRR